MVLRVLFGSKMFRLGLTSCLSNSHALFLLVQHIRSLNIRIDFYIRTALPLMLLTAYRAAELRLNRLKNYIEINIIEMALITGWLKLIWSIYNLISPLSAGIFDRERWISWPVDPVKKAALHIHCAVPPA